MKRVLPLALAVAAIAAAARPQPAAAAGRGRARRAARGASAAVHGRHLPLLQLPRRSQAEPRAPASSARCTTTSQLRHDEQHRWCLDCHDAADRDWLHLASGERVPFERSYLLCGQCHGEKLRDWRAGVHGRRTGLWNGQKSYLLCAHCHNPHQPRFRPIAPKPAPRRPERPGGHESAAAPPTPGAGVAPGAQR